MKILVVDDHAVIQAGVRQILMDVFPQLVVGQARDGQEAVGCAMNDDWDVAIVDISLPGRGGLDVLKQFKELRPQLPVLVFTMHPEEQYAVRALRAGAAGYLSKASLPGELVEAVQRVVGGGRYVSAALAERLASEVAAPGDGLPHQVLSDRELQILQLIAEGKTVKEIAAILSLSVNTISTYRGRILSKMHMKTSAELARYAVENNLLGFRRTRAQGS